MRIRFQRLALAALASLASVASVASLAWAQAPGVLQTWRRDAAGFEADPGCSDLPMTVGSLQKPFVAKAWAQSHPGEPAPRFRCEASDRCWLHPGHGELGLAEALAQSCNTYFRKLAAATPMADLEAVLEAEGFQGAGGLSPDRAIGLAGDSSPLSIRPSRLLDAYRRLVQAPWPQAEGIRQELLAGLRQAALTGTAAALGQRGYWSKTGTVPAPLDPLRTRGLVLAVDDSGWAILARLDPGTGTAAAAALAGPLKRLRPWNVDHSDHPRSPRTVPAAGPIQEDRPRAEGQVTVRLLDLLRPEHLLVRNAGSVPVPLGKGFLGAGSRMELHPGDRVGPGLLEVEVPGHGLLRRLQGSLQCHPGPRLTATLSPREYASGILEGELPRASPLRIPLGAAVLRFLRQPPRHRDADVCDSTHCAWFVGRGPRLTWADPGHGQSEPESATGAWGFSDAEWAEVEAAALQPGPNQWTSHCGGRPLTPHALWGQSGDTATPCPRHGPGTTRPWLRQWPAAALAKAFGEPVLDLAITTEAGVWTLRVTGARGSRALGYDAAHRQLAKALGWAGLPSPADSVEPVTGGWCARGVGLGHRVGLCLGD